MINTKRSGQASFTRTQEKVKAPVHQPQAVHVLGTDAITIETEVKIIRHRGDVPVFTLKSWQYAKESCLPGILGERISS